MKLTARNANAFTSTFYFFSTHNATAEKNKKSLQATAPDRVDICASLTRHSNGRTEARTDNSGFKKLAVQWLNEHWCFVASVVLADSFVLRNRQLLKPAKRYGQVQNNDTIKLKCR
jgi:hypothetical protein